MTLNTAAVVDLLGHQERNYTEVSHRSKLRKRATVGSHVAL